MYGSETLYIGYKLQWVWQRWAQLFCAVCCLHHLHSSHACVASGVHKINIVYKYKDKFHRVECDCVALFLVQYPRTLFDFYGNVCTVVLCRLVSQLINLAANLKIQLFLIRLRKWAQHTEKTIEYKFTSESKKVSRKSATQRECAVALRPMKSVADIISLSVLLFRFVFVWLLDFCKYSTCMKFPIYVSVLCALRTLRTVAFMWNYHIFLLSNSIFISGNSSFVYDYNPAAIWSTQQYFSHHDTASTWAGTRLWLKWTIGRFDASAKKTKKKLVNFIRLGCIVDNLTLTLMNIDIEVMARDIFRRNPRIWCVRCDCRKTRLQWNEKKIGKWPIEFPYFRKIHSFCDRYLCISDWRNNGLCSDSRSSFSADHLVDMVCWQCVRHAPTIPIVLVDLEKSLARISPPTDSHAVRATSK